MFRQAVNQWFWDLYDNLVRLIAANVVFFLFFFPVGFSVFAYLVPFLAVLQSAAAQVLIFLIALIIGLPILLTFWFAPVMHFCGLASQEKEPGMKDFVRGIRQIGTPIYRYSFLVTLIGGFLFVNIWFYVRGEIIPGSFRLLSYALAGFFFWMLLILLASAMVGIPLAARTRMKAFRVLKLSIFQVLRFPGLLFASLIFLFSLWVVGIWTRFAGILLFGFTGTGVFMNALYDVLLLRQELEAEYRSQADTEALPPKKWWSLVAEMSTTATFKRYRERYDREFKEILKPWEH